MLPWSHHEGTVGNVGTAFLHLSDECLDDITLEPVPTSFFHLSDFFGVLVIEGQDDIVSLHPEGWLGHGIEVGGLLLWGDRHIDVLEEEDFASLPLVLSIHHRPGDVGSGVNLRYHFW